MADRRKKSSARSTIPKEQREAADEDSQTAADSEAAMEAAKEEQELAEQLTGAILGQGEQERSRKSRCGNNTTRRPCYSRSGRFESTSDGRPGAVAKKGEQEKR
jgi:hypothetical protein